MLYAYEGLRVPVKINSSNVDPGTGGLGKYRGIYCSEAGTVKCLFASGDECTFKMNAGQLLETAVIVFREETTAVVFGLV